MFGRRVADYLRHNGPEHVLCFAPTRSGKGVGLAIPTLLAWPRSSSISRTKPLVRLLLNQIGRRLTEDLHAKEMRHRLLLMLDEFPALGRLDFFESALAFTA